MRRGSTKIGTIPDATLVGPKVLLINKYSASDGDLFPWSFLGKGGIYIIRKFFGIILLAISVRLFTANITLLIEALHKS